MAGIVGGKDGGCVSLALSGGYEDDVDLGEEFTYTGEGKARFCLLPIFIISDFVQAEGILKGL